MSIRLFYREDHNDEKPSDRQTSPSLSTKSTTTASSTPSSSSSLNHIVNGLSPPPPPRRKKNETLHILIGYESGQLCLFRFNPTWNFHEEASTTTTTTTTTRKFHVPKEGKMVEEGEGWELVWDLKSHRDAGTFYSLRSFSLISTFYQIVSHSKSSLLLIQCFLF